MVGWRRLHPLTIIKEMGALAWAIVGALVFDFEVPEIPGLPDVWSNPDTIIAVAVFAYAITKYLFTSYQLTDRTLELRRGVFVKTRQSMPRRRIQSVGVNTGLLGRFIGVSSVEVSAADTEDINLSYVSHDDADRLRTLLDPAEVEMELQVTPSDTGRRSFLNRIDPGALVVFGLTESGFVLGVGGFLIALVVLALMGGGPLAPLGVLPVAAFPVLRSLNLVGFQSWIEEDRVRVVRGFLNRRETDAPLERIQAIHVGRPPMRRLFGYETVDMATGDISVSNDDALTTGMVAPLVEIGEWRRIAERLIGTVAFGETDLERSSRHTIRRSLLRGVVATAALSAASVLLVLTVDLTSVVPIGVAASGLAVSFLYARARYRVLGWACDDDHLMTRRGVVSRSLSVIPIPKVQDVTIKATFFQRRLRIASVVVDTAGVSISGQVRAIDLEADDARRLADHLAHTAARVALPDGV